MNGNIDGLISFISLFTSGIWKGYSRPNEVQWVGGYIKYMALEFLEICLEFFFEAENPKKLRNIYI